MPRLNAHLESVNEGYFQHMRHALGFTVALLYGALCCLVHAFLPFFCEKHGSSIVLRLHDRMVVNRKQLSQQRVPSRLGAGESASGGHLAGDVVTD